MENTLKQSLYMLFAVSLAFLSGCTPEKTPSIGGLSAIRIADAETIVITPSGPGSGMYLSDANRNSVTNALYVKPGERFHVDDHRHIFNVYEFRAIQDGKVFLKAEETVNATSFGDGVKTTKCLIVVDPYAEDTGASNQVPEDTGRKFADPQH